MIDGFLAKMKDQDVADPQALYARAQELVAEIETN